MRCRHRNRREGIGFACWREPCCTTADPAIKRGGWTTWCAFMTLSWSRAKKRCTSTCRLFVSPSRTYPTTIAGGFDSQWKALASRGGRPPPSHFVPRNPVGMRATHWPFGSARQRTPNKHNNCKRPRTRLYVAHTETKRSLSIVRCRFAGSSLS